MESKNSRNIIRNIVKEQLRNKLNESFENKYENAIDTVEYYLNMCADGHQLSNEQAEQLTEIVQWLKETDAGDNPNTPEWIEAAENLLNQCQQRQLDEKKSKLRIEINPENKGKFTTTMKRTGKSAEELSHSKNPLTRKRAQFALNSRKWNKKKNANESTIGRIIREELENMSADTDTQNARPKWMDILDAINAAGVNHAPKTAQQPQAAQKPEPEPMQPQTQQQEPETQQTKASANEYQIGKYTFNPYTHTLTGSNGSLRIRPQYSNILNALCQNMGEEVELAKMFNITDDRKMRVALSNMRKLFADDPNVKIAYYGGKGKLVANQEGLNESDETEDEGNDYDMSLIDILNDCGWSFSNYYTVESKSTGKTGTRYEINKDSNGSCSFDELKQRLTQAIPQELLVFSEGQNKYAPEMRRMSVVLLDA